MPMPEIGFSYIKLSFLVIRHAWTTQDVVPKRKQKEKKGERERKKLI